MFSYCCTSCCTNRVHDSGLRSAPPPPPSTSTTVSSISRASTAVFSASIVLDVPRTPAKNTPQPIVVPRSAFSPSSVSVGRGGAPGISNVPAKKRSQPKAIPRVAFSPSSVSGGRERAPSSTTSSKSTSATYRAPVVQVVTQPLFISTGTITLTSISPSSTPFTHISSSTSSTSSTPRKKPTKTSRIVPVPSSAPSKRPSRPTPISMPLAIPKTESKRPMVRLKSSNTSKKEPDYFLPSKLEPKLAIKNAFENRTQEAMQEFLIPWKAEIDKATLKFKAEDPKIVKCPLELHKGEVKFACYYS